MRPRVVILALLLAGVLAAFGFTTCAGGASHDAGDDGDARGAGSSGALLARATYDPEGRCLVPWSPPAVRPNVVLVLIDTLRADALDEQAEDATREDGSASSVARPGMPFLSAMGRRHVRFTQASSPSPWTLPALCSLLTGVLPSRHPSSGTAGSDPRLAEVPTLAGILRTTLGYWTAAGFAGFPPATLEAFGRGYERVEGSFDLQTADVSVRRLLEGRAAGQPFHLLLHTFEAHDPYGQGNHAPGGDVPPAELARAVAELEGLDPATPVAELVRRSMLDQGQRVILHADPRFRVRKLETIRYLWDGLAREPRPELAAELEVAYRRGTRWVDDLLRELMAELGRLGLLENTIVIVTSDHGEAFGEHGALGHGRQLYDELLRVPLVMWGPPPFDGARAVDVSVGTLGLLPTLLDALGLPACTGIDGESLLPQLRGEARGAPVLAEEVRTGSQTGGLSVAILASARDERWKYVATYDVGHATVGEEVYDLRADPGELHDLAEGARDLGQLGWDRAFCLAVERVRDRVWGAAAQESPAGLRRLDGTRRRVGASRPQPVRSAPSTD